MDLPAVRCELGHRLTYLTFPEPVWGKLPEDARAEQLAGWLSRSREPGFGQELERSLRQAMRVAAEDYHLWARNEQLALKAIRASPWWRARSLLSRLRSLPALRARRRGAP
jgi:hypothetical protein